MGISISCDVSSSQNGRCAYNAAARQRTHGRARTLRLGRRGNAVARLHKKKELAQSEIPSLDFRSGKLTLGDSSVVLVSHARGVPKPHITCECVVSIVETELMIVFSNLALSDAGSRLLSMLAMLHIDWYLGLIATSS